MSQRCCRTHGPTRARGRRTRLLPVGMRAGMLVLAATGVFAASAAEAPAVTLGVTTDGRFFTLDGAATYLNGVSYYGSQSISTPSFVTQDLDDMVAGGFNWIRVWAFWEYPDPSENVSVMTQNGVVREPYMTRLKTLIAECNSRGMVVDVSLRHDTSSTRYPSNLSQHLACVQTLAQHLLPYRNVYIDVSNERDVRDSRYVSLSDCGQLVSAIKAIDSGRLCTASGVPESQSELNEYRAVAHVDFITPHLGRNADDPAQTVNRVRECVTWMGNLGFRFPIHLQEPFRRGYSTTYDPVVEDYYRDCSGGKIAEAAGWCLHNGDNKYSPPSYRPWRCFNMTPAEGRLYSQWDSVEQTVVANLDGQIGGASMKVRRYQAEYSEHLSHQIGSRDGWTWSANVASHAAGYLSYGPYVKTIPTGRHLVAWRMRIDSLTGDNDVVATLDVTRNGGAETLAVRQIRRQDFAAANTWRDFFLLFSSNAGDNLEFRTYWHDVARIDLDWVTLTIGSDAQLSFTDITTSSGTGGPYNNGEYGGHGIMWADVTGDARPDFYVTMNHNQDMGELFYRNVTGSTFVEEAQIRGINDLDTGSHGAVWCDLDNDGDYDLVNGAYQRNEVYQNNGSGDFTNRTTGSGFENVNLGSRGSLAFDFDKDGDLDIFINNWGPAEENEFYRNNGGWSYTRIDNGLRHIGGVQGVTEGDFDNDGDLDLLVGQGYGTMGGLDGPLMVMRNTGGSFSNVTSAVGLSSTAPQQQGAVFCDINTDGWLDLHIQRDTGNSLLYLNNGNGTFTQTAVPNGPGFMANFEDLDNDGDWDMVYAGDNKVYLNGGSGTFTASSTFSLGTINDPRAVAFADIDNDGDMDFFYAQKRAYNILIRNNLSGGGNWLKLRLVGANGQAGAFGAKVKTYETGHGGEAGYMISFREARSQEGYLGQNDPVLHFGLGPRLSVDVQVTFLDGAVVSRSAVAANQTIIINAAATGPPVIAEVRPDPDSALVGTEYVRQLQLVQGSLPVSWSVVQGPTGLGVDATGRVSGWSPGPAEAGSTVTIEIRASNGLGEDTETWQVQVFALPEGTLATFPFDGGAEGWTLETWKAGQYDPGSITWDSFGGNPAGHVRSAGNGSTNNNDSCTREGSIMTRTVATTDHKDIHVQYDVMAVSNTPPGEGCEGTCLASVVEGSCEDKLVVFYSTSGTDGPWVAVQTLSEGIDLPSTWTRRMIDLSGIAAASDNPVFSLRFMWQFNTAADSGRIDNVTVLGNPSLGALVDFDNDGDVDQQDFGYFQECLSGSASPHLPECAGMDLDGDGDVDQVDFGVFVPCLSGPGQPPEC